VSRYQAIAGLAGGVRQRLIAPLGFDSNDLRLGINFARMMLRDRFLGSSLGSVWAVLNPTLMLLLFCFVFGVVFKSRLPGSTSGLAFIIWLISGYGPWLAMSEALSNSTNAVVSQAGLVKNMAFKTEILPFAASIVALVPLGVSLVILGILLVLDGRTPNAAWIILPVVLVLQLAFIIGIGLVLAASNVFVRDIGQLLPNVLTLALFISPIFYPLAAFPPLIRPIAAWNPLYLIANGYREPIMNGLPPPLLELTVLAGMAAASLIFGLWYFRRLKTYFSGRI
jgi:lipopolysaccharide transport system permease protein